MRIRRRRATHGRRRPGMKGDWIVGADFNCDDELPAPLGCNTEVFDDVYALSLIDTQDLLEKEDSCTVVRVVGDIPSHVSYVDPSISVGFSNFSYIWREGIFVAAGDGTLPSAVSVILDPRAPGDIELDSWLWLRTTVYKFYILNSGGGDAPTNNWQSNADYAPGQNGHLDIRVKRKLKRGQELVYCAGGLFHLHTGTSVDNANMHAYLQAHLRCYVKF